MYLQAEPNCVDLNQLVSQKPADLDRSTLFQNRIYQEFSMQKGLLIKTEQLKEKMVTFLLYKKIYFLKFISNI